MDTTILTAPVVKLNSFDNLFIELTNQNCNLRCKHCYINFEPYKKIKDFISVENIKQAINDLKSQNIKMICLTGGEPLLHPDFNSILRFCLKHKPVTIFSNGININDKKARFLKKVEDEGDNELFFNISIDSFDERKNDDLRGRGAFRKAVGALQSLIKYAFTPTIKYTNYYNETPEVILENLNNLFNRYELSIDDIKLEILPYFDKKVIVEMLPLEKNVASYLECCRSRVLTCKGVYNCPMLVNDYRARSGSTFSDFSQKSYLETEICSQCVNFAIKNNA